VAGVYTATCSISISSTLSQIFVNPTVLNSSEETETDVEGCLSVPDKHGEVERHSSIKVKYFNGRESITETFEGTGFFWMRVTGKKYAKTDKNGNPAEGVILTISRYGAFATLAEGKDHLKPIDENNAYDLKPVPTAPVGNGAVSY